jgi:predicted anti-sigma-YlaC factor YlaD
MLTCKQVSELVSLSLDRPLGWLERWRLSVHLRACEGCRNFQRQMSFLRTAFRSHPVVKRGREDDK